MRKQLAMERMSEERQSLVGRGHVSLRLAF
jgi:hypothetical protein